MISRKLGVSAQTFFLIFSLGVLGGSLWDFFSDWQDFKGTYLIDRTRLVKTEGRVYQSSGYTSSLKKTTYYHYLIKYAYRVNGTVYESDEVTFDDNYSTSITYAVNYRGKYPIGTIVTVYYDPDDPTFAVLEPNVLNHFVIGWIFLYISLAGFIAFGIAWLVKWVQGVRKN